GPLSSALGGELTPAAMPAVRVDPPVGTVGVGANQHLIRKVPPRMDPLGLLWPAGLAKVIDFAEAALRRRALERVAAINEEWRQPARLSQEQRRGHPIGKGSRLEHAIDVALE